MSRCNNFIQKLDRPYSFLFACAYVAMYTNFQWMPILLAPIIIFSYAGLILRRDFAYALLLIIYHKSINGFAAQSSSILFILFNLLTNYIPFFILMIISTKKLYLARSAYSKYKYTFLYLILVLLYCLPNIDYVGRLWVDRILPLIMIVIFYIKAPNINFDKTLFIAAFRWLGLSSLIVYLNPYSFEIGISHLVSGTVFSQPMTEQEARSAMSLFSIPRNSGPSWDPRIWGSLCYAFLMLVLFSDYRWRKFDIVLSIVLIISTLSRGAIAVGALILIAYFLQLRKIDFRIFLLCSIPAVITLYLYWMSDLGFTEHVFDPLEQRGGFREYALEAFYENPIGHGIGYLSTPIITRSVDIGGYIYHKVSDAYLFIILAEIGIVGFLLFLLSNRELFHANSFSSLLIYIGFLLQLSGTDVPDMGTAYFAVMSLICVTQLRKSSRGRD